jgi:hypothetical protein
MSNRAKYWVRTLIDDGDMYTNQAIGPFSSLFAAETALIKLLGVTCKKGTITGGVVKEETET